MPARFKDMCLRDRKVGYKGFERHITDIQFASECTRVISLTVSTHILKKQKKPKSKQ